MNVLWLKIHGLILSIENVIIERTFQKNFYPIVMLGYENNKYWQTLRFFGKFWHILRK